MYLNIQLNIYSSDMIMSILQMTCVLSLAEHMVELVNAAVHYNADVAHGQDILLLYFRTQLTRQQTTL